MRPHVPFINSEPDRDLFVELYSGPQLIRMNRQKYELLWETLPSDTSLWLDYGFDGFAQKKRKSKRKPNEPAERNSSWMKHIRRFVPEVDDVDNDPLPFFRDRSIGEIVVRVLNDSKTKAPKWLTVPQLPYVLHLDPADTRKFNKNTAKIFADQHSVAKLPSELVFPVIIGNKKYYESGKERNRIVNSVKRFSEVSPMGAIWIVDSSLKDHEVTSKSQARFKHLLTLHEAIRNVVDNNVPIIAGPYWCMNLVLWGRVMATYPAIGLGASYQYYISGGSGSTPVKKAAIPTLRRWSKIDMQDFRIWLDTSIKDMAPEDQERQAMEEVLRVLPVLIEGDDSLARKQVASFYDEWLRDLEECTDASRSPTLFQMLSKAYSVGRGLEKLPKGNTPRDPAGVAQGHMFLAL